ncbi:MAG TPA: tetratricopeptide repeat protein, partial [Streptosporangiaceae bacterium]|nr:tetratricopeptide repeat protein [Streptosporangiaceae bacterium]
EVSDRFGQSWALDDLGVVQRLTGDYPAAESSHMQALAQFRDLGDRLGQAEALNNLGELLSQTRTTRRARDSHSQALAIAQEIGAPLEEARALEGIGRCHLHDGNPGEGGAHLRQALTIYQRIGASDARRVKETLRDHRMTPQHNPHSLPGCEEHQLRAHLPAAMVTIATAHDSSMTLAR